MATISLCMIVRNEEETLGRCLGSVAGIPDEIIIIDTGSEDGTKTIATGFTSLVFDFAWIDDFSAARNYSFAEASMDYVLWLDADDVLLPAERDKLLRLKEGLTADIDAVSMNYHIAFDASGNVTQSTRLLRLAKRSTKFRWVGVVHENLTSEVQFTCLNSDIVVTHQKPASVSGPSKRNLLIYEKHFAEGREMRPADVFHYARELQAQGEYERAIPHYRQFLDCQEVDLELSLFALHELATCYYWIGDLEKEWECALRSLELDVPRPEFSCRIAERFVRRNQFRQAAFWYELALQDQGVGVGDRPVENYPFKTWLPHKQLGLCYYQLADYARSLRHNELARQYLPDDEGIAANIGLLEKLLSTA